MYFWVTQTAYYLRKREDIMPYRPSERIFAFHCSAFPLFFYLNVLGRHVWLLRERLAPDAAVLKAQSHLLYNKNHLEDKIYPFADCACCLSWSH